MEGDQKHALAASRGRQMAVKRQRAFAGSVTTTVTGKAGCSARVFWAAFKSALVRALSRVVRTSLAAVVSILSGSRQFPC